MKLSIQIQSKVTRAAVMLTLMLLTATTAWAEETIMTNVSYMDWNASEKELEATTTPDGTNVYVLTGTETTLGTNGQETWYICNGALNYTSTLTIYGDVHLILADDCAMTITTTGNNKAIFGDYLTIYGQSTGDKMGSLTATSSESDNCISVCRLTANGCKISATAPQKGICVFGSNDGDGIFINGSEISATGTNGYGLEASRDINITTGSEVTANGGKYGMITPSGITIDASKVNATATRTEGESYGLSASDAINITKGSEVTANGGQYGMKTPYGITIDASKVNATGTNGYGLEASNAINITNGSEVTANGGQYGMQTPSGITIDASKVNATGGWYGMYAPGITINSGQVEATTISTNSDNYGLYAYVNFITLGWKNASDYIYASSYGVVKINPDKYFLIDGTETVIGEEGEINYYIFDGSDDNHKLDAINGKTLIPATPIKGGADYVVMTMSGSWKPIGKTAAFLPVSYDLSKGLVTLTEVQGAPDGLPVIFGSDTEEQRLENTFFVVGVPASSDDNNKVTAKTILDDYNTKAGDMSNRFVITDGEQTLAEILAGITDVPANEALFLVLANGKFNTVNVSAADLEKKAKPGLLLFILSKWEYMHLGSSSDDTPVGPIGTRSIGIGSDDGTATGIEAVENIQYSILNFQSDSWYDLQGRRLSGKPARKGLYLQNGKKVVVK